MVNCHASARICHSLLTILESGPTIKPATQAIASLARRPRENGGVFLFGPSTTGPLCPGREFPVRYLSGRKLQASCGRRFAPLKGFYIGQTRANRDHLLIFASVGRLFLLPDRYRIGNFRPHNPYNPATRASISRSHTAQSTPFASRHCCTSAAMATLSASEAAGMGSCKIYGVFNS